MVSKDILVGVAVGLVAVAVLFGYLWVSKPKPEQEFHVHADFTVFLEGKDYNFSQDKYMSTTAHHLSERVHLHDMDGTVIHVHAKGVTIGEFFKSVGMELDSNCFVMNSTQKHCNEGTKTLKFFVNGMPENQFENYEIKDLDRILISYGNENESELQQQNKLVSDRACIFSEKCPERGSPPPESCSTAGGCKE